MRFISRFFVYSLVFLFAALALSACGGSGAGSDVAGMQVGIKDDLCPSVTVKEGDQVTWRNEGSAEHQVSLIAADGTVLFDSGALARGDKASFTFSEAGVFNSTCSADGSLTGVITVE